MDLFVDFEIFETHEFLVTHFALVLMTFGLLSGMDTHMFDKIGTKTNDTTADLTFVRFTAKTMFLIVLQ